MKENGKAFGYVTAAATVAVMAGLACGQCANPSSGPDVIVGNIMSAGTSLSGIPNYTAVGDFDATSLGTTSCNVGSTYLNWVAGSAQHPVIQGALYQYREFGNYAVFEQMGQSWLKHGFTALAENLCCSCQNPGTGSRLGVGCSDPYTASRNADRNWLGPKWQVNASTGVFTMPHPGPTVTNELSGRLTFRKLEIAASNTNAIGSGTAVRHFGESMYVSPDDAAAGNKFNNASFRLMNISGTQTNWNCALLGTGVTPITDPMQRQKSAVEAWPMLDPQVVQDAVIVPNATPIGSDPYRGEGKFIVSSRAYDLGNGTWHYEYSVYNMNSHRSAGSFEVSVPTGVNVTNFGFHDVDYRDGDGEGGVNRSGTDWTNYMAGGKVGWATEAYATNLNANAIRWGTTYNFRFIADTAPDAGTATVGLWRPAAAGEPTSFNARVIAPTAPVGTPCEADWNGDDTVDIPDIFAFLSSWFAEDAEAQNFGGTPGVPAIFAFLTAWFAHGTGPC